MSSRKTERSKQELKRRKKHISKPIRFTDNPKKRSRRMTSRYTNVLQSIEKALMLAYHNDGRIDDRAVVAAIQSILCDEAPEHPPAHVVVDKLVQFGNQREDVTEELWRDGLRVALESIHNHSPLRRGNTQYLDFISQFV